MSQPTNGSATRKLADLGKKEPLPRANEEGASRQARPEPSASKPEREREKGPSRAANDTRPEIEDHTDLHITSDACEAVLAKDATVFVRDGELGRLIRARTDGPLTWRKFSRAIVRDTLSRLARFFRWKLSKEGEYSRAYVRAPEDAAAAVLERGEWRSLRSLHRITFAPFLRRDGTVCAEPGFDAESGVFADFAKGSFPRLPARPSREDARRALGELVSTFVDFPFETEADRYVPVAAVLTILARDAIDGSVPLIMFAANTRGTGKSRIGRVVSILATGRKPAAQGIPETDEEWAKAMPSMARAGAPMVFFDNVKDAVPFGASALDQALTTGRITSRVLGLSENVEVEIRSLFVASANNPTYRGDLVRRVLPCRMETHLEHPEDRDDFTIPDIEAYAERERGRILIAALTVLDAFRAAGRPRAPGARPWGSFERWSELVPAAIEWAGGPNVEATRASLSALDETRGALACVLSILFAWQAKQAPGYTWPAREALRELQASDAGREVLDAFAPKRPGTETSAKSFGRRLMVARGRVVESLRFAERGLDPKTRSALWAVEKVALTK